MLTSDITTVLPEIILAVYAMGALMMGVYGGKDKLADMLTILTSVVMIALALMVGAGEGQSEAFNGAFQNDGFARFAKVVMLLGGGVMLFLGRDYLKQAQMMKFEFPVLVALATVGMMMMVSAGDLMALYMGLELQSLALYVVAAFRRDSLKSTEAGLKYFVLGALSSGMLLYGASLVYGFTGTVNFDAISHLITDEGMGLGLLFGLAFIAAGLAFKISAAPFHMWTPDVYEGSPTAVTAFFATAPKVAAGALMARVLVDAFGHAVHEWQQILVFLAIASMFLGSIAAIGQTNIKRLMAYSSIAHMGFALVGLAAGDAGGVQSLLVYLAIYVTMNVGVFAFILTMQRDGRQVTDISALNMYSTVSPGRALALLLLMFSLAGMPPFLGFWAKYYVIAAAVDAGLIWLAVAAVISSAIGAFYYLRIIYLMYFGQETDPLDKKSALVPNMALAAAAILLLVGGLPGVNMFGVQDLALEAAEVLFH